MKKVSNKIRRAAEAYAEVPSIDFEKMSFTRGNPYANTIAAEGIAERKRLGVNMTKGRPKKGFGRTTPRSIRFSDSAWERLEACAAAEGMTLHAFLRAAVIKLESEMSGTD